MASAIHFSELYLRNLDAAINNLWLVSERAAADFAEEHDRRVALLAEFPERGQPVAGGRRSLAVGKSGYRIVYRVRSDTVRLIRLENVRRRKS